MRVAVVAEWYPSPADPVHGVWAHRQAVASAERGAQVRVLALRRPVPPLAVVRRLMSTSPDLSAARAWAPAARASLRPTRLDGIDVQAVAWLGPPRPISYGSWGYWMAPPLGRALDRLYESWPFDVLHAHCLAPAGHAAARWIGRCRPAQRPAFVVSAHGPDMIHVPERSAIGRRACLAALRGADRVIANSSWAQRRCEALAGAPLPVSVVHLGADIVPTPAGAGGIAAAVPERGATGTHSAVITTGAPADDGDLKLVTVAHLQARKQHDVVLRALARLDPSSRPRYLVIGDGERREPLQRLATQLGLGDRVTFLGQLPNDQAVARVAECDLFVMPGVEEPFGVAFVEAMGAGVPAIGARGEGGPEDIAAAGEGMLLVAPGDVSELAAELRRLSGDRAELLRLGAVARATAAASFSWERCGELTVAAYRDAIVSARKRP